MLYLAGLASLMSMSLMPMGASVVLETPPIFNITAGSLRDAGLQHGRLAGERIRAYLELDQLLQVWGFSQGDGNDAYRTLRRRSAAAYPQYADEMSAVAEGAGVSLDRLWSANLMIELLDLMGDRHGDHCSDVFAVAPGGYANGFAHGHNEDWSQAVAQHMYYVKYTAAAGSDFESCAGLIYPGSLPGWSVTWNAHGIFVAVNTLTPRQIRATGVTTAFVQREAICGVGRGRSLDDVVMSLESGHWAEGASVNIVDVRNRRMANVETWEDSHDVVEVTERMGNYSHFNMYKHLGHGRLDARQASTIHRQERVDTLPAPRSAGDIAALLSDAHDEELPIFRDTTMLSHVLDGGTGRLQVWCCQHRPSDAAPAYTWNVSDFWGPTRWPDVAAAAASSSDPIFA